MWALAGVGLVWCWARIDGHYAGGAAPATCGTSNDIQWAAMVEKAEARAVTESKRAGSRMGRNMNGSGASAPSSPSSSALPAVSTSVTPRALRSGLRKGRSTTSVALPLLCAVKKIVMSSSLASSSHPGQVCGTAGAAMGRAVGLNTPDVPNVGGAAAAAVDVAGPVGRNAVPDSALASSTVVGAREGAFFTGVGAITVDTGLKWVAVAAIAAAGGDAGAATWAGAGAVGAGACTAWAAWAASAAC